MFKYVAFKRVCEHTSLKSVKILITYHFVPDKPFEVWFVPLNCEGLYNDTYV